MKKLSADAPKPGTKTFRDYKASVCEHALKLKKKIDKAQAQLNEVKEVLEGIFEQDDKEFFCDLGFIKKEASNSYSIDESKINEVKKKIDEAGLTIDDYINQRTSWGVTAKLRAALNADNGFAGEIKPLITISRKEFLTIKTA